MPPSALPILIDTDIGDDVDDALALGLAVCSPELDLVGVTSVYGNVESRTRMALWVLKCFGREDIPVATGSADPLVGQGPPRIPNQAVAVPDDEPLPPPCDGSAVDLICRMAEEYAGELTLVTVGAMTNAAVALRAEPRLARHLKQIVVMGGVVGGARVTEYNIACDPEAAQIVFDAPLPVTVIGLDVTLQCVMTPDDVHAIAADPSAHTQCLTTMIHLWSESTGRACPILHDPLAVAAVFDPSLVTCEPRRLAVELTGTHTRGATVPVPGDPNTAVALDVDAARFVPLFTDRILTGPTRTLV